MTCGMHPHTPISHIGTYGCHLMSLNHMWIGWKITCHTWSLLAEKFLHMISGRQISKKTAKRSCWGRYLAHSWIDACIIWPVAESWAIGSVHIDLLVGVSVSYQVGWGDTYLFFLLASAWGQAYLLGEDCHVPIFLDIKLFTMPNTLGGQRCINYLT